MWNKLVETRDYLLEHIKKADVGIITGTGLDLVTGCMEVKDQIPYKDIPNFPTSTVEGHKGILKIGRIGDRYTIAMEGRFHLYEGYSPKEVVFPVRVMSLLGVKYLFICSAAGGLNPLFDTGDIMVITDHINLTGRNPLVGPNIDELGPRFPDMTEAYDPELDKLAEEKGAEMGLILRKGVYVGVLGPSLETRAETRFLRMIGADAVGMSTVMENIAAVHAGMKVSAFAVITNMNLPDRMEKSSIEEIISVARKGSERLAPLLENVIREIAR